MSQIILWGVNASPYVRKVRVALTEKRIDYKQKQTLPASFLELTGEPIPEGLIAISPMGRIPALQDGDVKLEDSSIISAYLDKKYSNGRLLYPVNAEAYSRVRWLELYADRFMHDVIYTQIFLEKFSKPNVLREPTNQVIVNKALQEHLPPILTYLTETLGEQAYIAGNTFSAADIAVVTQLFSLNQAKEKLSNEQWPNLTNYVDRILSRDSFIQAIAT